MKNLKHGEAGWENKRCSRLYEIWLGIKSRCYRKDNIGYSRYGGRGIKVCDEWKFDYLNFKAWAVNNGYADNLTIDRINNDGDYDPSNCRWITRAENTRKGNLLLPRNRGKNGRFVKFEVVEK